jgi:hypothetical protein
MVLPQVRSAYLEEQGCEAELEETSRKIDTKGFCGGCGSYDIRPSHTTVKILDTIAAWLWLEPFRCRCCRRRFYGRVRASKALAGHFLSS